MCPELLLGLPQSEKIDVWALGVLLAELLSGRSPFCVLREEKKGKGRVEVFEILKNRILQGKPRLDGLDQCEREILERLLSKVPGDRPSCEAIWEFEFVRKNLESKGVLQRFKGFWGIGEEKKFVKNCPAEVCFIDKDVEEENPFISETIEITDQNFKSVNFPKSLNLKNNTDFKGNKGIPSRKDIKKNNLGEIKEIEENENFEKNEDLKNNILNENIIKRNKNLNSLSFDNMRISGNLDIRGNISMNIISNSKDFSNLRKNIKVIDKKNNIEKFGKNSERSTNEIKKEKKMDFDNLKKKELCVKKKEIFSKKNSCDKKNQTFEEKLDFSFESDLEISNVDLNYTKNTIISKKEKKPTNLRTGKKLKILKIKKKFENPLNQNVSKNWEILRTQKKIENQKKMEKTKKIGDTIKELGMGEFDIPDEIFDKEKNFDYSNRTSL